jgi:deoxyribonuclease V
LPPVLLNLILTIFVLHYELCLSGCQGHLCEVVNKPFNRYNRVVKARDIHGWQVSIAEARQLQERLACQVSREPEGSSPQLVAGVDISVRCDGTAKAAVVILTFPGMVPIETKTVDGTLSFPYVPGLLTFREAPLVLAACEKLKFTPDVILVDGQGIAHPRRFGLASHLGILFDIPTIGCAKSRLCGDHEMPADTAGSYTELLDHGEIIGAVLRTKKGTKPLYVSIGHKCDLGIAVRIVLECCKGFRIPQPTRLAHLAAGGNTVSELAGQA